MLGAAPTLESNYWFGAQGNRLWVGQVEGDGRTLIDGTESTDEDETFRVKVRIMGYHTRSRSEKSGLPPKDLPWASVMMPTTETVTRDGAGSTHGLENGMWVLGMFMDGESAQQPLVMGSLGIVDKNQPFEDRLEDIGGTNNYIPTEKVLKTRDQNKSPGGHGAAGRGSKRGTTSAADQRQSDNEKVTIAVSNGKCGPRPENEISRILGDLFKFLSNQENVGGLLVDKLTGNITRTADIITGYFGRLANSVNGLLGDIKTLVVNELKNLFEKTLLPIITALSPLSNGRGVAITAGMKFSEVLFEIVKCIFQTILEKVYNLLLDILTTLVEDVLNTAFCQVSNILKGIVKEIEDGIGTALSALGQITSLVKDFGGAFNGNFLASIGKLISMFCDGGLSCILGIGDYTTGVGDRPDNAINAFFNRLETFGGLPDEVNTGLYGSDSFLSSIEGIELRDSNGNIAKGSLDCSKATSFNFPMIPNLFFTGIQSELDRFVLKGSIINYEPGSRNGGSGSSSGSGSGSGSGGSSVKDLVSDDIYPKPNYDSSNPTPYAVPVINSYGQLIGGVVTNPGFGLVNPPNVTIYPAPGWGSGGEMTSILDDNGGIKDLIVTNSGGGYPYFDGSVSTSEVVSTDENGDPNYEKIPGIYPGNDYWLGIITDNSPPVVVTSGDTYDESCAIIVEPGKNEENEVVLPELKPIIKNGFLVGVQVVKEGFGFTDLPKMYMSCGSGIGLGQQRKAIIKPILKFIPRKDAKDYLNNYNEFREIIDCVGHPGE
jgi:hypothetical protein